MNEPTTRVIKLTACAVCGQPVVKNANDTVSANVFRPAAPTGPVMGFYMHLACLTEALPRMSDSLRRQFDLAQSP
jgi:hypothetical protein